MIFLLFKFFLFLIMKNIAEIILKKFLVLNIFLKMFLFLNINVGNNVASSGN